MSPLGDVWPCQVCGGYHFSDVYGQMPYCQVPPRPLVWMGGDPEDEFYEGKHVKKDARAVR